jgi:ABC-type sugar transport system ATPase subunit
MARVSLGGITKRWPDGTLAVREVSLEIRDGEFMVLVGPSGCGKSTLLRIVAGLEEATAGSVAIDGEVVDTLEPRERDVAMVFQSYALYPHMTVRNNLAFPLRIAKHPRSFIRDRVGAVADLLGLDAFLDRKPRALSGGQMQRVALGRALVRDPQVFLFDEPLSNLDARLRTEMRAELKALHRTLGTTMVYVTHDQVEAMTLGDRIAVMNEGSLQQVATPLEAWNRPANRFVAGFLGSPPMNVVSGAAADVLRPAGAPAGCSVGFRPEAATLGGGVESEVELVEALGSTALVHLKMAGEKIVVATAERELPEGGTARFRVSAEDLHLFDGETGVRLP